MTFDSRPMKNIPEVTLWLTEMTERGNFLRCAIVWPGRDGCQFEESSMGVPAWAVISREASQTGNTESRTSSRGFPVHRLEASPTIANYTEEREAKGEFGTCTAAAARFFYPRCICTKRSSLCFCLLVSLFIQPAGFLRTH